MKTDYRLDELVKMIKKHYVDSLSSDVIWMHQASEEQRLEASIIG